MIKYILFILEEWNIFLWNKLSLLEKLQAGNEVIAPIMIVCKERYAKCARIAIETFLKHHDTKLYVVVDYTAYKVLSNIKSRNLIIIPIGKYRKAAAADVSVDKFHVFKYDEDGDHDRAYSSLKPLIMDKVIDEFSPESKYVLSLDADTLFSGNILNKVIKKLNKVEHKFDLYMVERTDPRLSLVGAKSPGSGFTLWKREGNFIKLFKKAYRSKHAGKGGGSQDLINILRKRIPSMLFRDPLLHFVSPDYKFNVKKPMSYTPEEILKLKPAYIHLHGANSYDRLVRFRKIFREQGD